MSHTRGCPLHCRSHQTQALSLALWVAAGIGLAGSGLAQAEPLRRLEQSDREHTASQQALDAAHQQLFQRMDRYYEVLATPKPDPKKVSDAKAEIRDANRQIQGILRSSRDRFETTLRSLVFHSDGSIGEKDPNQPIPRDAETITAESQATPETDAPNRMREKSASKNAPNAREASPSSSNASTFLPGRGSAGPLPQARAPSDPGISDAPGPREFDFRKRGGAAQPPAEPAP